MNQPHDKGDPLVRFVVSTPTFVATIFLLPLLPLLLRFSFGAFLLSYIVLGGMAGGVIGAELGILEMSGRAKHRFGLRSLILVTEIFAVTIACARMLGDL